MAVKLAKIGYGQLEPNKISAQYTKEIFDMLPLEDGLLCEQGMVLVYDQVQKKVRKPVPATDTNALFGLVYNEIVLEDERKQADNDYAMINVPASTYQGAVTLYPRLFGFTKGDTFTTNVITTQDGEALPAEGAYYQADENGYWSENSAITGDADYTGATAGPILRVVKQYTMPDGQAAVQFAVARA